MAKIRYEDWKPGSDALDVIAQAEVIAREYARQGYDLTLRQTYYQFVARGYIPNTDRSYKRLGSILNKARMAGLFDWDWMTDRTRNLAGIGSYRTPQQWLNDLARGFDVDHWEDQDVHVEVWVEKEALAGVVARAAGTWDVAYFSCRGYVSQSELWGAGQRLGDKAREGKDVLVLHLGDHDPSGIDMTRDIIDRLNLFVRQDTVLEEIEAAHEAHQDLGDENWQEAATERIASVVDRLEVRRIALNMDQVQEFNPPPNPAKLTDSRVAGYIEAYGRQSWELDALDPATLDALIQDNIREVVDMDRWTHHDNRAEIERDRLAEIADRYEEIVADL